MTEAFPDSFNAIRDALNLLDPTQQLLEIIRDHPESLTIRDIVIIYFELIEQSPSQFNKLTCTLVNLKNSSEITVTTWDRFEKFVPISIALALDLELHELLGSELAGLNVGPIIPSNEHLIASLLSAVAVKHSLCLSSAFSGAVHRGLYYDSAPYRYDVAAHQGLVLGACLQLSMNGSYFCGPNGFDAGQVLSALERIKNVGVVKHPDGQRLLEVRD
jgi:hypothetical protein